MNRKQHIILICLIIAVAACASANLYIASKYIAANKVVLEVDAKIDSLEHEEAAFYYSSRNEKRKKELFIKAVEGYSLSYKANVGVLVFVGVILVSLLRAGAVVRKCS